MEERLNQLLCDLEVFSVKLQNYHWNVTGKGFFLTHEKLEEYYEEVRKQLDEVAENIIMHGAQPFGSMEDFVKHTQITEAKNEEVEEKTNGEVVQPASSAATGTERIDCEINPSGQSSTQTINTEEGQNQYLYEKRGATT